MCVSKPNSQDISNQIISAKDAAKVVGVSHRSVRRWMQGFGAMPILESCPPPPDAPTVPGRTGRYVRIDVLMKYVAALADHRNIRCRSVAHRHGFGTPFKDAI